MVTLTAAYADRYKETPPTMYWLSAVDAAGILLAAIEKVAERYQDGTLRIGRQALRDALYATKDYPGATGRLACDQFGDCAQPRFNVLRLDDPARGIVGLKANVVSTYAP